MNARIGFDAKRAAQNRTGLGNYSRFVVRILSQGKPSDEYHLYVPAPRRTQFLPDIPTLPALRLHFPHGPLWSRLRWLWRVWGVTEDINRDGISLFHGLSNELPLNIGRARCRSVVTIHDLIFVHCPEYYHLIDRLIYNYKFRRACRVADRVIAVSEYTKREIMRYYGVAAEKIDVVYQGCDPAFSAAIGDDSLKEVAQRYGLPARYILYVGSIEKRKNLKLVASALRLLHGSAKDKDSIVPIVAVGKRTPYVDEIMSFLAEHGLSRYFRFIHNVPFADLPAIYRMATVFVYPSRIEGFGIPLLEAISSGVPAVACTGSCLEEAAGPGALYVGPDDTQGMALAISSLCNDPALRNKLKEAGRDYARNFTDERLCSALRAVYDKTLRKADYR